MTWWIWMLWVIAELPVIVLLWVLLRRPERANWYAEMVTRRMVRR